ncbi:MAG: molybdopterin-dependent oxidoreductase [bacterium]|nr:molybdopterin-dependent oxidoreductase [bacterium]
MQEVATFCRICEPSCGLVAEVEDGELVGVRPDRAHPVTKGFACNKGLAGLELHRDPDRLDHPMRRRPDGTFEAISWDTAITEIAERIREVQSRHGTKSFASYIGNPSAFNALAGPAMGSFLGQLGVRKNFSSGTQDCANKFAGAEAVYGTSTCHPIPDFDHTDFLLVLGSNPQVSRMSFVSISDPMAAMRGIRDRGGRLVYVGPRTIESARDGEMFLVQPDTDVYLLAALIGEVLASGRVDEAVVAEHASGFEGLAAIVRDYPAERVAPVVGTTAESIRQLARDFADAPSASATLSTGVNMGRQGTTAYWLMQMLVFLTGNLDRRGGNLYGRGFYPAAPRSGRTDPAKHFFDSEWGRIRKIRGSLPGNLMADAIRSATDPIRAMFVMCGNPVLSVGGEAAMAAALEELELLVVVDLYPNATAEHADYVLPAADGFERADLNLCGLGLQARPFVQVCDPAVEPRAERKPEWWIFGRLEQALGLDSVLDADASPPLFGRLDHMLRSTGHTAAEIAQAPSGTFVLPSLEPGRFYDDVIQTDDGRVACAPPVFHAEGAIERMAVIFESLAAEPDDRLKLISKREPSMHNSWMQNLPKVRGRHREPRLWLHPEDASRLGIAEGDRVRARNAFGEIDVAAALDDGLAKGVVAMPHGGGFQGSPALRFAAERPGENVNRLLPHGPGSFEPLSGQAFMTGIPVEVEPAVG